MADHVFVDATTGPQRCGDCGGRDFTCGRCGEHYVKYHEAEIKKLKLRVVQLQSELAMRHSQMAQMSREWMDRYDDAVPLSFLAGLPTEWRSMLSLRVEDTARELETILERWREWSQQAKVAREVRGEAAGDGSPAQR